MKKLVAFILFIIFILFFISEDISNKKDIINLGNKLLPIGINFSNYYETSEIRKKYIKSAQNRFSIHLS